MSKVRKIVKNTFVNFLGAVTSSLFMLAFNILMARYLGGINYGFLSFSVSYIALYSIMNDFGVPTIAVREIARDKRQISKYFSNVFAFKLIASVIVFAIAAAVVPLFKMDDVQTRALFIFVLSSFLYMAHTGYRWVYQAYQVLEYDAILNLCQGIFILGGGLIVMYLAKGILALAYVWLFFNAFIFLLGLYFTYRILGFIRLELDLGFLRNLFISALPIGLTLVVSSVYLNLDKILLFKMGSSLDVAWYSAANKLMLFLKAMIALYIPAIFPALSHFSSANESGYFEKLLKRSMYYFLMLTLAIAAGSTILAAPMIDLIFGNAFHSSTLALQIIIWGVPFAALNLILSYAFMSKGDQMRSLLVVLAGFFLNVVCNVVLIPKLGYIAPSISVLIAEALMFLLFYISSIKDLKVELSLSKLMPIVASLAIMTLFTYYLSAYNIFLNIIISGVIYGAALIITRAINEEDWNLIKKVYLKQI